MLKGTININSPSLSNKSKHLLIKGKVYVKGGLPIIVLNFWFDILCSFKKSALITHLTF